jgi:hypothetical protein
VRDALQNLPITRLKAINNRQRAQRLCEEIGGLAKALASVAIKHTSHWGRQSNAKEV